MRYAALLLVAFAAPMGCGPQDLKIPCVTDRDCDDGVFCNGVETCEVVGGRSTSCVRTARDCSASNEVCGGVATCDENADRCVPNPRDGDGDGSVSGLCGGDDCDDNDAQRYPGNTEVCDAVHHDEDCNDTTFGDKDTDGDGYVDAACCNWQGAELACGSDCNDNLASVNIYAAEVCNGADDNCNGFVDEGATVPMYLDADRDGYGAGVAAQLCLGAPGYSTLHNDCDDNNAAITPGTLICVPGLPANDIQICTSEGIWLKGVCAGQTVCYPQPNGPAGIAGTGVCM